jgi:hypothetical protein
MRKSPGQTRFRVHGIKAVCEPWPRGGGNRLRPADRKPPSSVGTLFDLMQQALAQANAASPAGWKDAVA